MNHYPRHVGDFIRDTVGLSLAERGAYTALLDQYYGSEKPIAWSERYRVTGATSKSDRAAVDYVMQRYFVEQHDGWHQKRADMEIESYREKSAKASASAEKRWCERNANAMRTHSEGNAKAMLAINHKPVTISKTLNPLSSSPLANVDDADPGKKLNGRHYGEQARELLEFLNVKTGRYFRPTEATLRPIVARLKEGHDVSTCKAVIVRRWRDWKDDDRMRRFLRPATLFGAEKFAQYVGEVPTDEAMERENAD